VRLAQGGAPGEASVRFEIQEGSKPNPASPSKDPAVSQAAVETDARARADFERARRDESGQFRFAASALFDRKDGNDPKAKEILTKAEAAVAAGRKQDAMREAARAIELARDPDGAEIRIKAHRLRARIFSERKFYRHAIAELSAAIADNPADYEDYVRRAWIRRCDRDETGAERDYEMATSLATDREGLAWILISQGSSLAQVGCDRQAIPYLDQARSYYQHDVKLHEHRGWSHFLLGQYEQALTDLSRLIELRPTTSAYFRRAEAYLGLGQFDRAIADCEQALKIEPGYIPALGSRGMARLAAGRVAEASADFTAVANRTPRSFRSQLGLGWASLAKGDLDAAEEHFAEAERKLSGCDFLSYGCWYNFSGLQNNPHLEHAFEEFARRTSDQPSLPWAFVLLQGDESRSAALPGCQWQLVGFVRIPGQPGSAPMFCLQAYMTKNPMTSDHAAVWAALAVLELKQRHWKYAADWFRLACEAVAASRQ
jgi:tetratricopeptide (TPR) repeat protein